MSSRAAISGTYSDLKLVKTRSVVQIVVEVPIEQAEAVVRAFGVPQPGKEIPIALARLVEPSEASEQPEPVKPRKPSSTPNAQKAAILTGEAPFRRFLAETGGFAGIAVLDADMAAEEVRARCKVVSRRELDSDLEAAKRWHDLNADYRLWLSGVAA